MVPDRQKVQTDGRNGRTDNAKTISLRLRRGIIKAGHFIRIICRHMKYEVFLGFIKQEKNSKNVLFCIFFWALRVYTTSIFLDIFLDLVSKPTGQHFQLQMIKIKSCKLSIIICLKKLLTLIS